MATSAHIEPFWFRNLKNSASFSPRALASVTSWQFCGAAYGLVLVTDLFKHLTGALIADTALQRGYRSNRKEHDILHSRNGYTHKELYHLFKAWGPPGRRLYLYIEAADTFVLLPACRAATVVLMNRLTPLVARVWPTLQLPLPLALFPAVDTKLLFAENLFQVSSTLLFNDAWATPAAASRAWKLANFLRVPFQCGPKELSVPLGQLHRLWDGGGPLQGSLGRLIGFILGNLFLPLSKWVYISVRTMVLGGVVALFKVLKGG